ncbi:MAG: arsenate reductase (glutaredoxin) [Bacteroidales bacterium]|nr:arsenate reductase (glutaredoxin) [Bacteroidales bacterium]
MLTIYHNPRCKKSRAGLQYLEEKTKDFQIRKYLNDPLSVEELKKLFTKLNVKPSDMVRTQEEIYKKELKGKNFTDEEWVKIIAENPKAPATPCC